MLKKWREHRGRGSSSSNMTWGSELGNDSEFNPHNEDSMALSQNPPLGHQQDFPVTPLMPPYIPISVQPYVPRVVPPARGMIEVLQRQNALLDNLGAKVSVCR